MESNEKTGPIFWLADEEGEPERRIEREEFEYQQTRFHSTRTRSDTAKFESDAIKFEPTFLKLLTLPKFEAEI